jgi:hypothetical protein
VWDLLFRRAIDTRLLASIDLLTGLWWHATVLPHDLELLLGDGSNARPEPTLFGAIFLAQARDVLIVKADRRIRS